MDKIEKYKKIIIEECTKLDSYINRDQPNIRYRSVIDQTSNHFITYAIGRDNKGQFVHDWVYHIELMNEKIFIHEDRSDEGIASILAEKGIDAAMIVKSFEELDLLNLGLAA